MFFSRKKTATPPPLQYQYKDTKDAIQNLRNLYMVYTQRHLLPKIIKLLKKSVHTQKDNYELNEILGLIKRNDRKEAVNRAMKLISSIGKTKVARHDSSRNMERFITAVNMKKTMEAFLLRMDSEQPPSQKEQELFSEFILDPGHQQKITGGEKSGEKNRIWQETQRIIETNTSLTPGALAAAFKEQLLVVTDSSINELMNEAIDALLAVPFDKERVAMVYAELRIESASEAVPKDIEKLIDRLKKFAGPVELQNAYNKALPETIIENFQEAIDQQGTHLLHDQRHFFEKTILLLKEFQKSPDEIGRVKKLHQDWEKLNKFKNKLESENRGQVFDTKTKKLFSLIKDKIGYSKQPQKHAQKTYRR